jgi:hypothetical protein
VQIVVAGKEARIYVFPEDNTNTSTSGAQDANSSKSVLKYTFQVLPRF